MKVETLERRLEATRKQADLIIELENDVAKAKKQEKVYEEAIEQLQAEQDALEAENARLRKGQGTADRQGESRCAIRWWGTSAYCWSQPTLRCRPSRSYWLEVNWSRLKRSSRCVNPFDHHRTRLLTLTFHPDREPPLGDSVSPEREFSAQIQRTIPRPPRSSRLALPVVSGGGTCRSRT